MVHMAYGNPGNNHNSVSNTPSFDAPIPSVPTSGPKPGHFAEQENQPAGPYTEQTTPWPHFVQVDPVTTQPRPILDDQNAMQPIQIQMTSYNFPWKTGLLGCLDDPPNAILTLFFPCLTFGRAAEIIDEGSTTCTTHTTFYCLCILIGCPCLLSCSYRKNLRAKYNLMESPANDCLTHFFCEYCAICQMHRELVKRGLDPSIGWQANVQRIEQQKGQMAPPQRQVFM